MLRDSQSELKKYSLTIYNLFLVRCKKVIKAPVLSFWNQIASRNGCKSLPSPGQ